MPLEKESLNNFLPEGFETLNQEGYKTNFSEDKIKTGYEKDIKDRVSGPNLNNLIDVLGKNTNTLNNYIEYLNNMPVASVPYVNTNNQLDYQDIGEFGNKADKNLANTGMITNCLFEVPQNIKVELGDNGLILKAGSVVTFPKGANNFEHYTVPKDMTLLSYGGASDDFFVFLKDNKTSFHAYVVNKTTSGPTAPTGEGLWYDTTNNLVKFYNSSGELQYSGLSFPFVICTRHAGTITGIKQIFNGIGYIGNTIWADKGIKGLIPNGRNADGTLNNIKFTTSKVVTVIDNNTRINQKLVLSEGAIGVRSNYTYLEDENYNYNGVSKAYDLFCVVGYFSKTATTVTALNPKLPFRAVDYNDIRDKIDALQGSGVGMPSNKYTELTLEASGTQYTAPANGWVSLNKVCGGNGQYINMANNANGMSIAFVAINANNTLACYLPVQKGQKFTVGYTATGATNHFRFIYAEGAI